MCERLCLVISCSVLHDPVLVSYYNVIYRRIADGCDVHTDTRDMRNSAAYPTPLYGILEM
jgi:hypothetical protein